MLSSQEQLAQRHPGSKHVDEHAGCKYLEMLIIFNVEDCMGAKTKHTILKQINANIKM